MHITNYNSNLTPKQDEGHGCGKSKFGILISKKCSGGRYDYRIEASRGLNEHPTNIYFPYIPAATTF